MNGGQVLADGEKLGPHGMIGVNGWKVGSDDAEAKEADRLAEILVYFNLLDFWCTDETIQRLRGYRLLGFNRLNSAQIADLKDDSLADVFADLPRTVDQTACYLLH